MKDRVRGGVEKILERKGVVFFLESLTLLLCRVSVSLALSFYGGLSNLSGPGRRIVWREEFLISNDV